MSFDRCLHLRDPNPDPDTERDHHPVALCRSINSNPTSKEAPPVLITFFLLTIALVTLYFGLESNLILVIRPRHFQASPADSCWG